MNLTFFFKGKPAGIINSHLVKCNNLSPNDVNRVLLLHCKREKLEARMKRTSKGLKHLAKEWMNLQRKLQKAWKFSQEDRFIKFWTMPGCSCPKMDNESRYPRGDYWRSSGCPIHGGNK